jgi:NitT/TauT family transport system substrate-binding protein
MVKAIRRSWLVACFIALLAVALTACGDDDSSSSTTTDTSTSASAKPSQPLTVSAFAAGQLILPYVAQDQGYFEDEGLDVTVKYVPGGATLLTPMVLGDELDIAATSAADIMPAIMKGAPIKLIAAVGSVLPSDLSVSANTLIFKDPSIKRPKDLEGKTVAFNTVGGSQELYTRLAVEADGGDPDKLKFVQVPVQNIPSAIDKGQVDAGQALQPMLSIAQGMGLKELFPIGNVLAGAPEASYWGKASFIDDHSVEINAFARAMANTIDAINQDPDLIGQALVKHGEYDQKTVAAIESFGEYSNTIAPALFEKEAKVLAENGLISGPKPVDDWLFVPSLDAEG